MRVLVCGGRDFVDSALLYGVLDKLNRTKTIICVIEGDARGADRLAGQWARRNHIDLKVIVPEYDQFGGRLAPPLRNQRMLDEGNCGVSGRRRNKRHGQARGQGGRGNT